MNSPDAKQKPSPQSWDDDDDRLLIQLKEREHLGWKQIARYFDNRTSNACQFRWRRLKSGQLKKVTKAKRFTDRSDAEYTPVNEPKTNLAARIPLQRTSSGSTIVLWTTEEDNLVRSRITKKLSVIELSILLPSKSAIEIQDRINFLERKKLSISSLLTDNISECSANFSSTSSVESDSELSNIPTPTRASSFSSNFSASSFANNSHIAADHKHSHQYIPHHHQSFPHQYPIYPSLASKSTFPDSIGSSVHQNNLYPFKLNPVTPSSSPTVCNFANNERLPSLSKVYSLLNR